MWQKKPLKALVWIALTGYKEKDSASEEALLLLC